ncbi:helix-turn-helix domain-containing protein [Actinosynnema sp. NPDC023587]|uniref:helix-turn-helix domain-containing protein n=1 Tax=Actinosynnema sp. NPDC023587 TaxID=3154695 RepID=UPI003405687E
MSVEAMVWVLNDAPIPTDRKDASSLAITLVGLANHADPSGRNAFPSVATLVRYTRLSERTVRRALDTLEELKLISPSDPEIVAAYIKRADRRPKGWDLAMRNEVPSRHPAPDHGEPARHLAPVHGVSSAPNGVPTRRPRGAVVTPEPSLNRTRTFQPRGHAPEARPLRPVCGHCDARDSDPISARVVWLNEDRTESALCHHCHPRAHEAGEADR